MAVSSIVADKDTSSVRRVQEDLQRRLLAANHKATTPVAKVRAATALVRAAVEEEKLRPMDVPEDQELMPLYGDGEVVEGSKAPLISLANSVLPARRVSDEPELGLPTLYEDVQETGASATETALGSSDEDGEDDEDELSDVEYSVHRHSFNATYTRRELVARAHDRCQRLADKSGDFKLSRERMPERMDMVLRDASVYVLDALNALNPNHSTNRHALQEWRAVRAPGYAWLRFMVAVVHLMLTLIEPRGAPAGWEAPLYVSLSIEFIICCFYIWDTYRMYVAVGPESFALHWRRPLRMIAACAIIFELILAASIPGYIRLTRVLRPTFLTAFSSSTRSSARLIVSSIVHSTSVMVLICFHVLFFGTFGYFLFSSIDGYAEFGTVGNSILSMFILLTTANFPDVMLPAFNASQWSVVFFVLYILVGIFFLTNLVLANLYQGFLDYNAAEMQIKIKYVLQGFEHAFELICKEKLAEELQLEQDFDKEPSVSVSANDEEFDEYESELEGTDEDSDAASDASIFGDDQAGNGDGNASANDEDWASVPGQVPIEEEVQRAEAAKSLSPALDEDFDDTDDVISIDQWFVLSRYVRPDLTDEEAVVLWYAFDQGDDGTMGLPEFMAVCSALQTDFKVAHSAPSNHQPTVLHSLWHRASVAARPIRRTIRRYLNYTWERLFARHSRKKWRRHSSHGFDMRVSESLFDFLVLINVVVVLLDAHSGGDTSSSLVTASHVLVSIFVAEVLVKIFAYGLQRYMRNPIARFDAAIIFVSVIAELTIPSDDANVASLLRFLRLVRLLRIVRRFRPILSSLYHSFSHQAMGLFASLLLVMYVFAILGMELFHGRLSPSVIPPDESYAQANYFGLNFDSLPRAMLTLFMLLVVNNWFIVAEATAVWSEATWAYFVLFYFIGFLVAINLVVAFLLDTYMWYAAHAAKQQNSSDELEHRSRQATSKTGGLAIASVDADQDVAVKMLLDGNQAKHSKVLQNVNFFGE